MYRCFDISILILALSFLLTFNDVNGVTNAMSESSCALSDAATAAMVDIAIGRTSAFVADSSQQMTVSMRLTSDRRL